ncbi:MAG: hypothetical protein CMB64_05400 [Euryarchaeota archaeon]|jgi:hypothetical protein|nr:hypothetical protein [Euryarchaeota archaeon]
MLSNRSLVKDHLKNLCDQWVSHGKNINSSFQLYKENFIILFADEDISGCSIDSSNNLLRESLNQLKIDIQPNSKIGIFIGDKVEFKERSTLIKLIRDKELNLKNKIVNTTVKNKEEYDKNWILDINKSWLVNFIK